MTILVRIWRLLDGPQRRTFVALQGMSIVMALSMLVSVAAIVPFFAVLADPQQVQRSESLMWVRRSLGFDSERDFVVALGAGFVSLVVIANAINLFGSAAMNRFALRLGDAFRLKLFRGYLYRDYIFHVGSSSAELFNNIIYEVDRVIGLLQSLFALTTNVIAVLFIAIAAAVLDPPVAIAAAIALGVSYLAIYAVTRQRLLRNGIVQTRSAAERARAATEGLGAIKELLVLEGQEQFLCRFAHACGATTSAARHSQEVAQQPRHVLECIAVGGLVGVALALSAGTRDSGPWLSQLTFMAFAAYRLLPALQQVFHSVVRIRANQAALEQVEDDLAYTHVPHRLSAGSPHAFAGPCEIRCNALSFRYAADRAPAVSDVNLRIEPGTTVGLIGANGSGKTTLVDLLSSLLIPQAGSIEINGVELNDDNRHTWKAQLSYVPQGVFLLDGSIADNIALGVPAAERNSMRLRSAAQKVGLAAFIDSHPHGYDQHIGERGIRLSGGQRQLLGIARALYSDKPVLILDEATSALDPRTELGLIRTLQQLRGMKSIILVTHRMSSLKHCDLIIEMHEGTIVRTGSYAQVCAARDDLRRALRDAN
jgi:ATP-binding cassette, subfamily B, bacterial PglK